MKKAQVLKNARKQTGMSQKVFAAYFGTPLYVGHLLLFL